MIEWGRKEGKSERTVERGPSARPPFVLRRTLVVSAAAVAALGLAAAHLEFQAETAQTRALLEWRSRWHPAAVAGAELEINALGFSMAALACSAQANRVEYLARMEDDERDAMRSLRTAARLVGDGDKERARIDEIDRLLAGVLQIGRQLCPESGGSNAPGLEEPAHELRTLRARLFSTREQLDKLVDDHFQVLVNDRLASETEALIATNEEELRRGTIMLGVLFVLTAALWIVTARKVTGALRLFAHGYTRIGSGELTVRLAPGGHDEIGFLVAGFNRMAERLESTTVARQRLAESELALSGANASLNARLLEAEQLRAALEDAAREWKLTFDAMASPVIVLDDEGRLLRTNKAAARAAAREPRHCVGLAITEFGREQPWRAFADLWNTRAGAPFQQVLANEADRHWEVSLNRVSEDSTLWLARATDVSREVDLGEFARREERTADLGRLVAGIAHEVRNPLFSIGACLDTWEDEAGLSNDAYSRRIRIQVDRLRRLMQDLLDYGNPSRMHLETVQLAGLWREVELEMRGQAQAAGATLDAEDFDESLTVHADAFRLGQVLRNVVDNAIQHTPPAGRVVMRVENHQGSITCVVEDSGAGFPIGELQHVFQPFHTRRKGGTGLGLAIARRFVEAMNGSIVAENRADGGARVRIRLLPGQTQG